MKKILAFMVAFLTTIASVIAAETAERTESILDSNPVCMERDGPDCVTKSQFVPPPGAASRDTGGVAMPVPTVTIAPDTRSVSDPVPPPPAPRSIIIAPRP